MLISKIISASRPSSFVGSVYGQTASTRLPSILTPSTSGCTVICEICHKPSFYADENVLQTQPENIVIKKILTRLRFSPQPSSSSNPSQTDEKQHTAAAAVPQEPPPNCQWCEGHPPRQAELCCEVCGYYYCSPCQSIIHPSRGPLKDHLLIPASTKRLGSLQSSNPPTTSSSSTISPNETKCDKHFDEFLTMFCASCRIPVCCHCVQEIRHTGHEMQSIQTAVKSQKVCFVLNFNFNF
uniref:B box-type domain-containing protein n=1 Tax=Panagrolaimus superbus TaxID=310955 RepID=A0A914YWF0_9BILA